MSYPPIPESIREELFLRQTRAATVFQQGWWPKAAELLGETYEFLLQQQRKHNRRFHKGWELHNWGIALLQLGEASDGITKIYMAYVEDALFADVGEEDRIDEAPAARALARYAAPVRVLQTIKAVAKRRKERGDIPQTPSPVLAEAALEIENYEAAQRSTVEGAETEGVPRRRTIEEGFDQPLERRCFVGGNYYGGGPNLEEIRQAVVSAGFDAIVAEEFEIGEQDVHHRSLLLLHLCSKAIFEVTFPAGQLMELERCRDHDIRPLLLRNTLRDQDPHVSAMIGSMAGNEVRRYVDHEGLSRLVVEYLRVEDT